MCYRIFGSSFDFVCTREPYARGPTGSGLLPLHMEKRQVIGTKGYCKTIYGTMRYNPVPQMVGAVNMQHTTPPHPAAHTMLCFITQQLFYGLEKDMFSQPPYTRG